MFSPRMTTVQLENPVGAKKEVNNTEIEGYFYGKNLWSQL